MMNAKTRLVLFDVMNFNSTPLGICVAVLIGLWTMKIEISKVLMGQVKNRAITACSWFLISWWLIFILLSIDKALKQQAERETQAKKDETEAEERQNEQQHRSDSVAFQNEIKT